MHTHFNESAHSFELKASPARPTELTHCTLLTHARSPSDSRTQSQVHPHQLSPVASSGVNPQGAYLILGKIQRQPAEPRSPTTQRMLSITPHLQSSKCTPKDTPNLPSAQCNIPHPQSAQGTHTRTHKHQVKITTSDLLFRPSFSQPHFRVVAPGKDTYFSPLSIEPSQSVNQVASDPRRPTKTQLAIHSDELQLTPLSCCQTREGNHVHHPLCTSTRRPTHRNTLSSHKDLQALVNIQGQPGSSDSPH